MEHIFPVQSTDEQLFGLSIDYGNSILPFSILFVEAQVNSLLFVINLQSSETDLNDDGLLDMLDLDLQVNTPNGTAFHFVQLLLIFSYQLKVCNRVPQRKWMDSDDFLNSEKQEVSHVTMEAMAMLQYDSGLPLATLNYVGDLQWVQRKVLSFQATDNRYNQSIIDQFEVADILLDYNARDCNYLIPLTWDPVQLIC